VNAERTFAAIAACNSAGKSAGVVFAWTAFRSRRSVFGTPFEAAFSAPIESMTADILLINQGRILAEGNVHHIRDLIDEHPHTVYIQADATRALAREFLSYDDVLSLKFEGDAVVVQTGRPDAFYARLTNLAATGELGVVHEVTSPDDNLQAVFQYLVKS